MKRTLPFRIKPVAQIGSLLSSCATKVFFFDLKFLAVTLTLLLFLLVVARVVLLSVVF